MSLHPMHDPKHAAKGGRVVGPHSPKHHDAHETPFVHHHKHGGHVHTHKPHHEHVRHHYHGK